MKEPSAKAEIRIYDITPSGPPVLIPLGDVMRRIVDLDPRFLDGKWTLVGGTWGLGEDVCRWDDLTQGHRQIVLDGAEIWRVLKDGDQRVEHARFVNSSGVQFGVVDSSWIFVKGPEKLVNELQSLYQMTEIAREEDKG